MSPGAFNRGAMAFDSQGCEPLVSKHRPIVNRGAMVLIAVPPWFDRKTINERNATAPPFKFRAGLTWGSHPRAIAR